MSTPVPTGKKEKGSAPNPSSGSGQPSAAKDPSPQPAQPQADKAGMQRNSSAKDLTKLPNKSESKLTPSNSYNQLPSPAAPAGKKDKKEAAAPPAAPPAAKPAETETKTELGKKRATFHPDIPLNEKAPPPLRDFLEQKIPTLVSVGSKQHLQSATEFMIDVVFESDYDDGTTSGAPAAVTHNEDEDEGVDENNFALYDIKDADENNDAAAAEVEEIAHEADEAEMRVLVEEPFYVVDLALVARKYTQWTRLFPRIVPHYAIKCNPDLGVVTTLAWLKAGFDCASKAEIQLALSQNVELNRIIFANPCKAIPELKYAKEVGVTQMTFDNAEELRKIKEHYPEGKLLLRIRTEDSHSTIPLGKKFGCELRDVEMLLKLCHQLQLTLIGVSFHVGSGCYDVDAYPEALKNAKSVFDMAKSLFGWNLSLLDIGGGFPGTNDDKVTIEMIAKAVNPLIDELFPASTGVRIVSEPGRYFVEASHTLCVEVIGKYDMLTNTMQRNRTTELDSEVSSIAGSVAGSVATSIATSIASSIRNRQGGWGVARPNQPIMKKTLDGGDHTPSSRTVHSIKIDSFAAGSPANVNKAAHTKFDALPSLSLPPQSNEITLTKTPAPSASPTNPDSPKHPSGLHVSPRGSPFSKPIGSPFASPNLSSRKLPSSFPSPHIGLSNSPHLGSVNVAGMGTIVNGMPLPIAPEDLPTDRLPRSSAPAQSLDPAAPAASATDSASGPTLSSGPSAAGANDQVRFVYYINEGVYGSFKDRVLLQETFNPNVLWCKRLTDALAAPRKESVTHMKSLLPIPTKKPDTLTVGSSATPAPAAPAAPSAPAAAEPAVLDGGDLELEIALRNMPHFKSRILGPTTHPLDVICPSVNLPELDVGDWLYFTRMGAYTISLASCFNGYEKPNTLYIWTDQEDEEIKVELDAQGKKVLLAALDRKRKVKKIRRGMKRRMVRIRKKKVTKKKGKPTKKKRNRIPQ